MDRNGNIIAKTVPVVNLGINPNLVIDKERLLAAPDCGLGLLNRDLIKKKLKNLVAAASIN